MGGKHRQGPTIAAYLAFFLEPHGRYVEPFCGALGVASRVAAIAPEGLALHLSDVNEAVINMWKACLVGWEPPGVVTEADYNRVKAVRDPKDPMTAYCGYGVSFGAKWFGGYARDPKGKRTTYAANARRSTLLRVEALSKVSATLRTCSYEKVTGPGVYYLDPPYAGRTKAHGVDFDSEKFWDYARARTLDGPVLVTEFTAPEDWVPIHNFGDTVVRHQRSLGADGTTECIFMHQTQAAEMRE